MSTASRTGAERPGTSALPPAEAVVEQALAASRSGDCVVLVNDSDQCEIRFANNTATTNGRRRDRRVTALTFREVAGGTAVGMARQSGAVDVESLIRQAEADAETSPPAPDAAPLVPPSNGGADDLGVPAAGTDWSVLEPVVGELGGAFQRAGAGGRVLAGFAEHDVSTTSLGTSTGLRRRHVQPTGAIHLVGRQLDGPGSAWSGIGTADFTDITIEQLEADVGQKLSWSRARSELSPGRYEVILPPSAVADLMAYAVESMGGRDAEEGRSVYSAPGGRTRVGEQLSPLPLQLWGDPTEAGLTCAPFLATEVSTADVSVFDNGLPVTRTSWLRDGRVERLVYHRAGAGRSGVAPTVPVDNLILEVTGAQGSLDDLVRSTERGLWLTCLWYIRVVDPTTLLLTGLTRDGVFLVEDGKVTGSVNNFRFNESPVDLLGRVVGASSSVRSLGRELGEWFNRTRMPALRVRDFNMSSVSPAS